MFIKVFKYDFKSVFFKLIPMFIIVPILAILTRLTLLQNFNTSIATMISVFINGMFILSLCVTFLYSIIIVINRYVKSLFKEQGYLTHTLPVNKHLLLLSQILVAVIISLISVLFMFLNIMIAYFSADIIQVLKDIIWQIFQVSISQDLIGQVILTLTVLITSSIQSILLLYLGIALGHAHAKNKVILSIIYCIAIVYGYSLLANMINLFFSSIVNSYTSLMVSTLIESLVAIALGYFLTIFTMNRHLNLE